MTLEIGLPPKIGLQVSLNEELLHLDRHLNAVTGWPESADLYGGGVGRVRRSPGPLLYQGTRLETL